MGSKFKKDSKVKKKPSSRKDIRKQLRKEKKFKKNEYFKNKNKKIDSNENSVNAKKLKAGKKQTETSQPQFGDQFKMKKQKPLISSTKPSFPSFIDERNKMHKAEIKEKSKLESGMRKMRKKALLEANESEDKEIKKLEKQLKLNKRKSKTIPKSFSEEGLGYLLEVCSSDKLLDAGNAEMNLQDSGSEFEDDFALVTGKGKRKLELEDVPRKKKKLPSTASLKHDIKGATNNKLKESSSGNELEESFEGCSDDESIEGSDFEEDSDIGADSNSDNKDDDDGGPSDGFSDEIDESDESGGESGEEDKRDAMESDEGKQNSTGDSSGEDEDSETDDNNSKSKAKDGTWEDIYGRLRDKDGSVIKVQEKGKYVPPQLRAQQMGQDAKRAEELSRLLRQLKGLVNRLAESNIQSIANQIDELYMRNSRNDMNDSLLGLMTEALVRPVLSAERLVMEHALLVSTLHANVGLEVGAHFLQSFVLKFDAMYKEGQDVENKELDNVLLILCHMYNFKVFHSVLLYDLMNQLSEGTFGEKEVELVLLVLRSVGFSLRRDDPMALKDLVLRLQKKASESASQQQDNPRMRFMLDTLLAVKNNNMAKIPQYDHSLSEHLKKLQRSLVHKGKHVTELKVTLEDLLKAEERGRWWIVGSAWSGGPSAPASVSTDTTGKEQFSQSLLDLARKQRMNTDTRRNIFCILMSAEDYLDAFEKLLRLGLKSGQEQEIVHVLVHCLLNEKKFNPYYAHLATHACQTNRKHQMSIQYHLWDKLKELVSLSQSQITNLAKFLAYLFLEKALPISVLKVMQFSEMDKPSVRLLRQTLLSLLLAESTEAVASVFARVAQPDKLRMFRESLRLFLHHFVLRNTADLPEDKAQTLRDRVALAETALTAADTAKLKL